MNTEFLSANIYWAPIIPGWASTALNQDKAKAAQWCLTEPESEVGVQPVKGHRRYSGGVSTGKETEQSGRLPGGGDLWLEPDSLKGEVTVHKWGQDGPVCSEWAPNIFIQQEWQIVEFLFVVIVFRRQHSPLDRLDNNLTKDSLGPRFFRICSSFHSSSHGVTCMDFWKTIFYKST